MGSMKVAIAMIMHVFMPVVMPRILAFVVSLSLLVLVITMTTFKDFRVVDDSSQELSIGLDFFINKIDLLSPSQLV